MLRSSQLAQVKLGNFKSCCVIRNKESGLHRKLLCKIGLAGNWELKIDFGIFACSFFNSALTLWDGEVDEKAEIKLKSALLGNMFGNAYCIEDRQTWYFG